MTCPPELMTFEELKALDQLIELQIDQDREDHYALHEKELDESLPDVE